MLFMFLFSNWRWRENRKSCHTDMHTATLHFTSSGSSRLWNKLTIGIMASTEKNAFSGWKFRHHFIFEEDKGNNTTVQCKLCLPAVKHLSSSKDSTSNLKKHLQRKHPRHLHLNEAREDTISPEMGEHGQAQKVILIGLEGVVDPARAGKKWENLKKTYKDPAAVAEADLSCHPLGLLPPMDSNKSPTSTAILCRIAQHAITTGAKNRLSILEAS